MGRKKVVKNDDNDDDVNAQDEEAHSDNSDSTNNKKKQKNTKKLPKNSKNKHDDDDSDEKDKPAAKNKSHERQTKKEDNKQPERDIKDQKNDADSTQIFRRVKPNINLKLDVPECYAIYFKKSKNPAIIDKSKIKLLIKNKASGRKKTTKYHGMELFLLMMNWKI